MFKLVFTTLSTFFSLNYTKNAGDIILAVDVTLDK